MLLGEVKTMAKKPYNFREVDADRRCRDCGRPLKRNLLARHPNAERCYWDNRVATGHPGKKMSKISHP